MKQNAGRHFERNVSRDYDLNTCDPVIEWNCDMLVEVQRNGFTFRKFSGIYYIVFVRFYFPGERGGGGGEG